LERSSERFSGVLAHCHTQLREGDITLALLQTVSRREIRVKLNMLGGALLIKLIT